MWSLTLFTFASFGIVPIVLAGTHSFNSRQPHRDLAKRADGDVDLHKRFSNARFTFYDAGMGACGKHNDASDFIVALNKQQYGGGSPGPMCFKQVSITVNGKTATATIMDECMGCPYGALDMSRGLFDHFASESEGEIYGTWTIIGEGGGDDDAKTTTKHTTTSTHTTSTHKHTTTSTHTTQKHTTSSEETTKTSSPTTSTTSQTPTTTAVDYNTGAASGLAVPTGSVDDTPGSVNNLDAFNQVIVGLGAIIVAGSNLN